MASLALRSGKARVAAICAQWSRRAASSSADATRPSNVGILALEFYAPHRFVSQEKLESADGVSKGKYTIGLGQTGMAFVDDREDVNSIALTAVARLLENYGVDPASVGRLEVGTETLVDKSKSTKTELMRLLAGNRDVEGATVLNACYGGTGALFNSVAWAESAEARGRYAVYVAADVAVYEAGPARPTGGVGAVAALVGPDAPLPLVPRTRTTHAVSVYDFYKPRMETEYPTVDGKLSQAAYLAAVDECYAGTRAKAAAAWGLPPAAGATDTFQRLLFHSPYNKLVQQSFRRLLFSDARAAAAAGRPLPPRLAALAPFAALPYEATLANRDLDKALAALDVGAEYTAAVAPSDALSKAIGNSYTAALHANLLSLVSAEGGALAGARVGAFSYGSGALATMFALAPRAPTTAAGAPFTLDRIARTADVAARLAARREAEPAEFADALAIREAAGLRAPAGSLDNVPAGAFYLADVSPAGVRSYERK